ncbi:hypothetical protein Tco_0289393 [Tanacetum coccineum]
MARRRRKNRASMQVVFIPKAKSYSAPDILAHPLTLTSEFGPGVTPGARLMRVVSLCVGIILRFQPEGSSEHLKAT